MPVSRKRKGKDIKHLSNTGRCKTIKGKQVQNDNFHISTNANPKAMMQAFPNMHKAIAAFFAQKVFSPRKKLQLNVKK